MSGIHELKRPSECSEQELADFERLVRVGFEGSDDSLPTRIRAADLLAFRFEPGSAPVAIAGLKRPEREYTAKVFAKAACDLAPDVWRLELGWVFVSPDRRGAGIARALCGQLLQRAADEPVFATTRPDNLPMMRILESLGFRQTGRPFVRRNEVLLVHVRSGQGNPGRSPPFGSGPGR